MQITSIKWFAYDNVNVHANRRFVDNTSFGIDLVAAVFT